MFHLVRLMGEVDLENASAHGDLLCRLLDLGAGDTLLVDCSELAFLELRGMSMMQRVHRHGVERGTNVRWVALAPAHRRLLALAGLDRRLCFDDAPAPPVDEQDDQVNARRSSDSHHAEDLDTNRGERWVRDVVIDKIPGAGHVAE